VNNFKSIIAVFFLLLSSGIVLLFRNFKSDRIPDVYPIELSSEEPELLWRYLADAPIAVAPVVCDTGVLVYSARGTLFFLDKDTGAPKWIVCHSRGTATTPLVIDSRAVINAANDNVLCIDLRDGNLLWRVRGRGSRWHRPQVYDHQLFVRGRDDTMKLRLSDGHHILSYPSSSIYPLAFSDAALYLGRIQANSEGNHSGSVYSYSLTGNLKWQLPIADVHLRTLVYESDQLLLGADDGIIRSIIPETGRLLWMYDLRKSSLKWIKHVEKIIAGKDFLIIKDQVIVTVSQNNLSEPGALASIDAENKKLNWIVETPKSLRGPLLGYKDFVVAHIDEHAFFVMNINTLAHKTVNLSPKYPPYVGMMMPAIAGDRLFVTSYDGYIRAFDVNILINGW
jgi:outer membrane protein assembly factor BamB